MLSAANRPQMLPLLDIFTKLSIINIVNIVNIVNIINIFTKRSIISALNIVNITNTINITRGAKRIKYKKVETLSQMAGPFPQKPPTNFCRNTSVYRSFPDKHLPERNVMLQS